MTKRQINLSVTSTDDSTSQVKGIFHLLMTGAKPTPLDVFKLFNCLSANQRFSDLRLKYGLPLQSQYIKTPTGKTVKEHWLDQSYIDAVNAGIIKPPFAM